MNNEKAEMLQAEFEVLSQKYDMVKSYGYFVDANGRGMVSFNDINDRELMFMISQLVVSIAAKNEAIPDDVLASISEAIRRQYPDEQEIVKNQYVKVIGNGILVSTKKVKISMRNRFIVCYAFFIIN